MVSRSFNQNFAMQCWLIHWTIGTPSQATNFAFGSSKSCNVFRCKLNLKIIILQSFKLMLMPRSLKRDLPSRKSQVIWLIIGCKRGQWMSRMSHVTSIFVLKYICPESLVYQYVLGQNRQIHQFSQFWHKAIVNNQVCNTNFQGISHVCICLLVKEHLADVNSISNLTWRLWDFSCSAVVFLPRSCHLFSLIGLHLCSKPAKTRPPDNNKFSCVCSHQSGI